MQTMKGQFDSEEYILATPIKWSWLEESLCTSLNTSAKFGADCTAQQVGAGQGYMSVMARIHPKWTESNGSLPQSIIAKIPSLKYIPSILNDQKTPHNPCKTAEIDSIMDNLEKNLNNFHNTEVSLYAMVQDNDLHLKIPKTYVLQKFDDECAQGVIVMEDMGEQSIVFGVYHVISVDDIYQIIDQLVELHKFSFEHPECISSIGRFTLARFLRMEDQAKAFSGLVRSLRYLEKDMAPMLDHIADLWYDICDADVIDNIHNLIGMPAVLVHGDLWTANTIWREHNGKRELAAIVDWQSSHPGNAVEDIGRIISCSLTAKERRKNWRDILQYYYGKLAEKMQKHPPFLFEQLEECFIRVYPFAMCGALLAFGPVMRSDIEKRYPERREELLAVMREKMIGLVEDILHFHSLNARRREKIGSPE